MNIWSEKIKGLCVALGLVCLLHSLGAAEEVRVPVKDGAFYVSCPGDLGGKAQWNGTEAAAELDCPLYPGRLNWAYLNFRLEPGSIPAAVKSLQLKINLTATEGMTLAVALESDGFSHELTGIAIEPGAWGTLTLPLDKFKPAAWNRKHDGERQFDPSRCRTVLIGISGRPSAAVAKPAATLMVRKIAFLP